MGESWRIGVDDHERTELVTRRAFRLARNPIFLRHGDDLRRMHGMAYDRYAAHVGRFLPQIGRLPVA